jgi:hypothetical protein
MWEWIFTRGVALLSAGERKLGVSADVRLAVFIADRIDYPP